MDSSLSEQQARGARLVEAFLDVLTAEVRDILDYDSIVLIPHSPAITSPSSQNPEL